MCLTDPPVSMGLIIKVSDPIRNLMAATHYQISKKNTLLSYL